MINLGEEFKGSGAMCLSHELVSCCFTADCILDPNGVHQILFNANIELGLGEGRVRLSH